MPLAPRFLARPAARAARASTDAHSMHAVVVRHGGVCLHAQSTPFMLSCMQGPRDALQRRRARARRLTMLKTSSTLRASCSSPLLSSCPSSASIGCTMPLNRLRTGASSYAWRGGHGTCHTAHGTASAVRHGLGRQARLHACKPPPVPPPPPGKACTDMQASPLGPSSAGSALAPPLPQEWSNAHVRHN